MSESVTPYLDRPPHLVTIPLPADLVEVAEANLALINAGLPEAERPYGLADLIEAALRFALTTRCRCEPEDMDAEDRRWVAAWRR